MDINYVLHLTHPTHSNYYVHTTKDSARYALNEYVSDCWSDLMGKTTIPTTTDEAVALFYDSVEGERWAIEPSAVLTLV